MTVALLLVGFGNVARRFVRLLDEMRPSLDAEGVRPFVVGIASGSHGCAFDANGLDAVALSDAREAGTALGPAGAASSGLRLIGKLTEVSADARVVIETTPLDVRTAEPAVSHVRAAFAAGAHVVTANKGPVAIAYRALADEAARAGVSFLFEGAVMDGIPIFNLVRETLPASDVRGFRGVVNSTTNYIISAMEQGEPFEAALGRMQAAGVAEADASLDIDGWDAAAKTAALANVWLDAAITPNDVFREAIGPATGRRAVAARRDGQFLKVVARAQGHGAGVRASVSLETLASDDPLAQLDGQANAIEIDTWPAGRIVITQRDGGLEKTAYAIASDLVTLVRRLGGGSGHTAGGRAS